MLEATFLSKDICKITEQYDCSQFGDIYQEDYFINFLKDDVHIVKELPLHLQTLDVEAIGSQVSFISYFLFVKSFGGYQNPGRPYNLLSSYSFSYSFARLLIWISGKSQSPCILSKLFSLSY